MSERRYIDPTEPGAAPLPATTALQCLMLADTGAGPLIHAYRAQQICAALFSVLTESQQERALQALGWQLVSPPPVARRLHVDDDGPEVLAP